MIETSPQRLTSGKYALNQAFFDEIDCEAKAYYLGLLYADGYNCEKGNFVCLSLQERDKHILDTFLICIEANYPIKKISLKSDKWQDVYKLQLNSRKLCQQLANIGCVQGKTKILEYPHKAVPSHLANHFIRGYFDGDGSVWEGKRYTTVVKDKTRKSGHRERIIHNVKFTLVGAPSFLLEVQEILHTVLGIKKTKLGMKRDTATLEYSGRQQLGKFYEFMYTNATIFFIRKKIKFESIVNFNT